MTLTVQDFKNKKSLLTRTYVKYSALLASKVNLKVTVSLVVMAKCSYNLSMESALWIMVKWLLMDIDPQIKISHIWMPQTKMLRKIERFIFNGTELLNLTRQDSRTVMMPVFFVFFTYVCVCARERACACLCT